MMKRTKGKKIACYLLCLMMLVICVPQNVKALDIFGDRNKEKEFTPINVGVTYTYDCNGCNGATLKLAETQKEYYFKLQVTAKTNYTYKFKVASTDGAYIKLYDADYKQIGGGSYDLIKNPLGYKNGDSLKTISDTLGLTPGVYYIGIKLTSTDAVGSIYLGVAGSNYNDPQYNVNEKINENTISGLEAAKTFDKAKRIALGQTYTFDWSGIKGANLSVPVTEAYGFYKLIIQENTNYTYRFKVSTPEGALVKLYDADYKEIGGSRNQSTPDKLSTISDTVALQPGVYYIGIRLADRKAAGNLYLAPMNSEYVDPQYQEGEIVNDASVKGFAGADNYQEAPRLALGQVYTFDCNSLKEANLSLSDSKQYSYYKFIVTEKANYIYTFKVDTSTGAYLKLYDSDYNRIGGNQYEYVSDSQKTLSDVVALTPGAYYVGIALEGREATGSIKLEKKLLSQKITVSKKAAKTVTYKAANLKKKAATFNIGAKAQGKITYKVKSGATKYIKVSKSGKVTLKKGAKKGNYVIQITAAKTGNYAKTSKKVKVVVK